MNDTSVMNDDELRELDAIRFWSKVDKNGPIPEHNPKIGNCWIWIGGSYSGNRGKFYFRGKSRFASHVSLWIDGRDIPKGKQACHHCDNQKCVRTGHIFIGSQSENMLDCSSKGRLRNQHMGKKFCKHGHPFSGDNLQTYMRNGALRRRCVKCQKAADERHRGK